MKLTSKNKTNRDNGNNNEKKNKNTNKNVLVSMKGKENNNHQLNDDNNNNEKNPPRAKKKRRILKNNIDHNDKYNDENETQDGVVSTYQFGPADDIDERDADDPLCATEYIDDMYHHFRSKEESTSVRPLYMENQPRLTERMRSILVDWLVDVHVEFKLVPETLYLTINLIDRYLERRVIARKKLQLVGVTCLLIASKYEEVHPVDLQDLVPISERVYTRAKVCL